MTISSVLGVSILVAATYSLVEIAIAIVVIAAIVALVMVALRHFQIPVPQWVYSVLGIVFVAVVVIIAIKFIAGL